MHVFPRRPAEPEAGYHEKRTRDAGEWQAAHFFVGGPGALEPVGAQQDGVPGEVHAGGDEGAETDGQEGEAVFAAVEGVDGGEDYGVGLQVDVEYCV